MRKIRYEISNSDDNHVLNPEMQVFLQGDLKDSSMGVYHYEDYDSYQRDHHQWLAKMKSYQLAIICIANKNYERKGIKLKDRLR